MYRQGDLLIVATTEERNDHLAWTRVENGIVERGEATGHAHRLVDGEIHQSRYGELRLVSSGAATLVHDEHDTITLPEGEYKVIRQREYVDDERWSRVSD